MMEAWRSPFPMATHAYEQAIHAGDAQPHRLDLLDRPRWPTPLPSPPMAAAGTPARDPVVRHLIESPGRLGFAFGFGFAAGQWVFRAAVALISVAILIGVLWRIVASTLH